MRYLNNGQFCPDPTALYRQKRIGASIHLLFVAQLHNPGHKTKQDYAKFKSSYPPEGRIN
jgi:hypothetical protein